MGDHKGHAGGSLLGGVKLLVAVVNTLDKNAFLRMEQAIERGLREEFGEEFVLMKGMFAVTTPRSRKQPPFLKKLRPEQYKKWKALAKIVEENPDGDVVIFGVGKD